jgi:hypothetical protein
MALAFPRLFAPRPQSPPDWDGMPRARPPHTRIKNQLIVAVARTSSRVAAAPQQDHRIITGRSFSFASDAKGFCGSALSLRSLLPWHRSAQSTPPTPRAAPENRSSPCRLPRPVQTNHAKRGRRRNPWDDDAMHAATCYSACRAHEAGLRVGSDTGCKLCIGVHRARSAACGGRAHPSPRGLDPPCRWLVAALPSGSADRSKGRSRDAD